MGRLAGPTGACRCFRSDESDQRGTLRPRLVKIRHWTGSPRWSRHPGEQPFFIEEVVEELVEAGYLEGERGSSADRASMKHRGAGDRSSDLLARIDSAWRPRGAGAGASVIGKEVPEPALRMVAGVDDETGGGTQGADRAGFLYEG